MKMKWIEKWVIGAMFSLIINMIPGEWSCGMAMRVFLSLILIFLIALLVRIFERDFDEYFLDEE